MESAYGFIETRGLTAAIEAADAMVKAAKVHIIKQQKIGGTLVTILIEGELAACQAAVDAGREAAERIGELISAHVIPRPVDDIQLLYGSENEFTKPKRKQTNVTVPKIAENKKQSGNKANTAEKNTTETENILTWLVKKVNGVNINEIAEFLKQDTASARRIVKKLMDEGSIEKVHQKYFFLSKGKNK